MGGVGTFSARTCVSPLPFLASLVLAAWLSPLGSWAACGGFTAPSAVLIGSSGCSGLFLRFADMMSFYQPFKSIFNGHHQVFHDVIFPIRRVFAHVKVEDARGIRLRCILDLAEAHFLSDELLKLTRRDFAQPFEPGDLARLAQLASRGITLG